VAYAGIFDKRFFCEQRDSPRTRRPYTFGDLAKTPAPRRLNPPLLLPMRSPVRTILFLILLVLAFVLFHNARAASGNPDVAPSKILGLFAGVVVLGVGIAILFVTTIMPAMVESMTNLFFNPNEEVEKDVHSEAISAVARGEYEEAIEAYRAIYEEDPTDTLALSESAKIYCDHLANPATAAELLEEALKKEWPPEGVAFLSTRLVDVYWKYQHDGRSARALLLQIMEAMPDTRHAANASHRLQEIDKELALED
jgi:tetratricopeptide (TPR) repeat protein